MTRYFIYHLFVEKLKELLKEDPFLNKSDACRIIYKNNPDLHDRIKFESFRKSLSTWYLNDKDSKPISELEQEKTIPINLDFKTSQTDGVVEFKRKRLYFDIETSPNIVYSWRTGYNLTITPESIIEERKIICIAWKWEGEDEVYALNWDEMQSDKQMLEQFLVVLGKSDEVVAHNGDRFDIKWLRTRCYFHEIPMFPDYKSFDTLKKARSKFNFNSNKLDYISKFSGSDGKISTNYKLWIDVMGGDDEALNQMVEYCKKDVLELEKVFLKMNNYVTNNTNHAVLRGKDKSTCPECGGEGELFKMISTPMGTKQVVMKCSCGKAYKISFKQYADKKLNV